MARRAGAALLAVIVAAIATVSWSMLAPVPANAAPGAAHTSPATSVPMQAPGGACSTEEWQADFRACVDQLDDLAESEKNCKTPPTPSTPDSGLAGWFADEPAAGANGVTGLYTRYGYAGYDYTTYGIGCAATLVAPEHEFETVVANGEFMLATAIIGASNAMRERAWEPKTMWAWADPLVSQATTAVYKEVFTVFGVITLVVIGVYLLWRSQQADMSNAVTTVGWAAFVMVAVTTIVAWPVQAANLADKTLTTTLGVIHDAVGPRSAAPAAGRCVDDDPAKCRDNRPPAVRASDTATETMLYRNWLRGLLGSADSVTAQRYGEAMYDAKALSWGEAAAGRGSTDARTTVLERKQEQWMKVAKQIEAEDKEAYEYLTGVNGMDRIGSGFIALLSALLFAMFDLTASVLVLLGFLIFRWAVIAAPILGTFGLLQPASAGLRRLGNVVVAAIFNIAIFGTGAAIYLLAVDLIMNTASLAGWLQVVLIWLCGIVGWLLLRPYRRITQLGGGKDGADGSSGSWHRRFFRDLREASRLDPAEPSGIGDRVIGRRQQVRQDQTAMRPESRHEDPAHGARRQEVAGATASAGDAATTGGSADTPAETAPTRPDGVERVEQTAIAAAPASVDKQQPTRPDSRREPRESDWMAPDVPDEPASFVIYRPGKAEPPAESAPQRPRIRSEAR